MDVEVHFDYMQDVRNPFAGKHLRNYLSQQMDDSVRVPEGFDVPSNKFALVMQLAHIRKHVIGLGVGFRQLADYFILLKTASDAERAEVASLLDSFGLRRFAGALWQTATSENVPVARRAECSFGGYVIVCERFDCFGLILAKCPGICCVIGECSSYSFPDASPRIADLKQSAEPYN